MEKVLIKLEEIKQLLLLQSKEILTLNEFALYSGISVQTAYKLSAKRSLRFYRQGKHLYVKREDMITYLLNNPVKSNLEIENVTMRHFQ